MPSIQRTKNRIWMSRVHEAYGGVTRMGFACTDIPAARFGSDRKTRFDQYRAQTNLELMPELNAVILSPAWSTVDASLSAIAVANGDVGLCTPAVQVETGGVFYHCYNAAADHLTDFASTANLPAAPCLCLQQGREVMSPVGMASATQSWSFSFGNGWTLTWGRAVGMGPTLAYNGTIISRFPVARNELEAYLFGPYLVWKIYNVLDRLMLLCNACASPWVVDTLNDQPIGRLPAAPWRMQGTGGEYTLNVSPYTFATSGSLETDWIEHFWLYDAADLSGSVWPALPDGASATLTVADELGTAKRYGLAVTGPGTEPVAIQVMEARYAPTIASPVENWVEVTDWVDWSQGVHESCPLDLAARTLDFTLLPYREVGGQTLWQALGGLYGEYAVKFSSGYEYDDGTDDAADRFYGLLQVQDSGQDVGRLERMPVTVRDKWQLLSEAALLFPPNLSGMRVDAAIRLLAQWAGIPDTLIDADTLDVYLDTNTRDATRPPWLPANGASAGQIIRQIAEAYGVIVEFDTSGRLQIRAGYNSASVATYTLDEGATAVEALTGVHERSDLTGAINVVLVEGLADTGYSLLGCEYDYAALFTPDTVRYKGRPVVQYERRPDQTTQAGVDRAAVELFEQSRRRGHPQRVITGAPTSDLYQRLTNEVITLVNTAGSGTEDVLLTHLDIDYGLTLNRATATGEVRP